VPEANNLTTFLVPNVMKSWNLNLLEPSGPHRACYETLPLLPLQRAVELQLPTMSQIRSYPTFVPKKQRNQDYELSIVGVCVPF
jgi:hypothetical protein